MVKRETLRKIKTYKQFEKFCKDHNLNIKCDIGYRGGGIGVYGNSLASYVKVSPGDLPHAFGAGCNYLGGGVRGSIFPSTCNTNMDENKFAWLTEFADACVRVYEDIENESGLNNDEDEDGETNWDAKATKASRDEA